MATTAEQYFRAGELVRAVEAQVAAVKAHPTASEERFFLFVLLAFAGDYERAEKQLEAYSAGGEVAHRAALWLQQLLEAERQRARCFAGEGHPLLPDPAPSYLDGPLRATELLAGGKHEDASRELESAAPAIPGCHGTQDGASFIELRDCDDVLGPLCEVYAQGRYLWIPFERIRRLSLRAPAGVLDLLWVSAEIEEHDGRVAKVQLPALYPGSAEHESEAVRLGRSTEWRDDAGIVRGVGQKMLLFADDDGEREVPLLEIRELVFGG